MTPRERQEVDGIGPQERLAKQRVMRGHAGTLVRRRYRDIRAKTTCGSEFCGKFMIVLVKAHWDRRTVRWCRSDRASSGSACLMDEENGTFEHEQVVWSWLEVSGGVYIDATMGSNKDRPEGRILHRVTHKLTSIQGEDRDHPKYHASKTHAFEIQDCWAALLQSSPSDAKSREIL